MRRNISLQEKIEILEESRQPEAKPSEICRKHQISLGALSYWQNKVREGIAKALEPKKPGKDNSKYIEERLRDKITKLQVIISEITAENLELKKNFGD